MYTKEIAKAVREQLKKELPGWKFSVTFRSYSGGSSIDLTLMEGPEEVTELIPFGDDGHLDRQRYAQLNPHSFGSQGRFYGKEQLTSNGTVLTPKGWEVMEKATKILAAYHWDKSDIQSDYFHCNFYMHVGLGKWNKDYQVKK